MKFRVLVVDDEPDVLTMVGSHLAKAGFQVMTASNGDAAFARMLESPPSLAIIDLTMPGMSGLDLCRCARANSITATIPIVILTAQTAEVERIVAFELGIDDYITKPFSPRELVLRISAILRYKGTGPAQPQILQSGSILLDPQRHKVTAGGAPVDLTATEFKLLHAMISARNRMQPRETLLEAVWGFDSEIELRTIDTHLRRLRKKLGPAGAQIHAIRGFGYRLSTE